MNEGAKKLQQVISRLQRRKSDNTSELPHGLRINAQGKDLIRIDRLRSGSTTEIEFCFVIRVTKHGTKEVWWPIEYKGRDQEIIKCESSLNGRTIVNLQKQASLVELANTWAGSLVAQESSSRINDATL